MKGLAQQAGEEYDVEVELRDYFAGLAMQAMINCHRLERGQPDPHTINGQATDIEFDSDMMRQAEYRDGLAELAFKFADSMLAAR